HTGLGNEDAALCAEIDSGRIKMVDVGVGSGCIALALASELPQAEIHGCDVSDEALEMARVNAARLGLGSNVLFRKSNLLEVYAAQSASVAASPAISGTAALAPLWSAATDTSTSWFLIHPMWVNLSGRACKSRYAILNPGSQSFAARM